MLLQSWAQSRAEARGNSLFCFCCGFYLCPKELCVTPSRVQWHLWATKDHKAWIRCQSLLRYLGTTAIIPITGPFQTLEAHRTPSTFLEVKRTKPAILKGKPLPGMLKSHSCHHHHHHHHHQWRWCRAAQFDSAGVSLLGLCSGLMEEG